MEIPADDVVRLAATIRETEREALSHLCGLGRSVRKSELARIIDRPEPGVACTMTRLRKMDLAQSVRWYWTPTPLGFAVHDAITQVEGGPVARPVVTLIVDDERRDALARLRQIEDEIKAALLVEPHRLHNRLRIAVLHPVRDAIEALDVRPTT